MEKKPSKSSSQQHTGVPFKGFWSWKLYGIPVLCYPFLIVLLQTFIILYFSSLFDLNNSYTVEVACNNKTSPEILPRNINTALVLRIHKEINPVVRGISDRMFYNRVPKCGSSTLMDIIMEMSLQNNFTFARSPVYMTFYMTQEYQADLISQYMRTPAPLLYERHLHFLDFKRFNSKQPIYINLIRDPLDRLVSFYYFRRYQDGHIRQMALTKRVRSYDSCVLSNHSECVDPLGDDPEEGYFKMIPFFCGQEDYCRIPGEKSLFQAIQNVKKHYTVIGITEQYQEFIETLEFVIPRFFTGASAVYDQYKEELKTKHKTTYKLPVSNEVQAIMYPKLKEEYQFYVFIRNRFQKLHQSIQNAKERLE